MMVTGDLGNAGALDDLVRLGAPRYEPEVHGPPAGMNLIQAYKQLGRFEEARALIRRLQGMHWAPMAQSLAALESEVVAASLPKGDDVVPEVGACTFSSPAWTRGLFEPDWLMQPRSDTDPFVALFTFANETLKGDTPQIQLADTMGRLTRALPLYLAETLRIRFRLRSSATIFVVKDQGPAVFGSPLARETLEGVLSPVAGRRVVIAGSLVETGVKLDLWEMGSAEPPTIVRIEASHADVPALVSDVERAVVDALKARGALAEARPPAVYRAPPRDLLAGYVSALEQLLFQLLAANDLIRAESLWNERGYFETYFGLVDEWSSAPDSARLIAVCGTLAASGYKSAILEPYRKITLRWIDEAPPGSVLRQLAPAIFKQLGDRERFERWSKQAPAIGEASYVAWLDRVRAEPWAS
jgi:hypothetical protein